MLTLIFLSVFGLVLLFLGFVSSPARNQWLGVGGVLAALVLLLTTDQNLLTPEGFDIQMSFDAGATRFSALILCFSALILGMAGAFLRKEVIQSAEFVAVLIFSLVGALMLTAFTHMVTLFVGLEILGISLYILAGTDKRSDLSSESALKYLLLGAFATGLTLFGMAMLYGATGTLDFAGLASGGAAVSESFLFQAGVFFLLIGILFKVAAAPFHFWSPDVYEGAPSPVMLFMSVVVKTASFAALFRIFGQFLHAYTFFWWDVVYYACIASLLAGNLLALVQKTIKRQLAYSSISHTGYLLMALLVVPKEELSEGVFFYLFTYGLASLVAFSVILSWFESVENPAIRDLRGAGRLDVPGSIMLTLAFLSMAGIPLTGGFFSKLFMFAPAMQDGLVHLLVVGIVSSVIGAAYYMRPIMNVWFSSETAILENAVSMKWVAILGGTLILAAGLFPDAVIGLLALI